MSIYDTDYEFLPPRQREAFETIAAILKEGRSPLTAELLRKLKLKQVSSLTYLLKALEEKGLCCVEGGVQGQQRLISFTDKGRALAKVGVPLVGKICAGPMGVDYDFEDVVEWIDPGNALRTEPNDLFFIIDGNSMTGDGLIKDDVVQIRRNALIGNGEIGAVAHSKGNLTGKYPVSIKHIYHEPKKNLVRLVSSNPTYEDMIFPAEEIIPIGPMRGSFRRVGYSFKK